MVYEGRLKTVAFQWRQGLSPDSPLLNLTGATVTVYSTTLATAPTIIILDPVTAHCSLTFPPECTVGKRGIREVLIALTFASDPGASPDPVRVEIAVV